MKTKGKKEKGRNQGLVPTLRFPEFRDAGEWKVSPLGKQLLKRPEYGINAPAVPYSKNLPTYLRITDISEDGYFLEKQKVSVAKEVVADDYLLEGDIALARTGASVGKAYKYRKSDGELVFAGFLIRIRPDQMKLNTELLFHFLSTEQYWAWVSFTSARSGQPGINGKEYALLPIPLPHRIAEQQKIADCLSSLDELIVAQTRKLDTLKAYKKGMMQNLFPAPGQTIPALRFPEFLDAGKWVSVPIAKYFKKIRNGFVGTATPHYVTEGIPYLQGKNIKQGQIDATGIVTISKEFHQRQKKSQLRLGDILMVQSGHVGECAMVNKDFSGSNCHALIVMSPNEKADSDFFIYYFYSSQGRRRIYTITTGNTIKHILASDVRALMVCIPNSTEQQKIAACLSSLDELIAAQAQKLDTLKAHKKGLMQQLFPNPHEANE